MVQHRICEKLGKTQLEVHIVYIGLHWSNASSYLLSLIFIK